MRTAASSGPRLRVATYNVHGCVGLDGKRSEARIAEVIAAMDVDVIGLQELDLNRRRSAGMDQAGLLAEQLGWGRFFHPAMRQADEEYGDAILSRHPMNLRQASLLPGAPPFYCRETRGALWVDVATPLGLVHVFNTHFGLGRRERLMQGQVLAGPEWIGRVPQGEPVIVLGDFNSVAGSPPLRALTTVLRDARDSVMPRPVLRSYPTRWPAVGLDHIFLGPSLRARTIDVARDSLARVASDHFPIVAEICLAEFAGE